MQTRRNLYADLAERLSGRIGFEPDAVTDARYEVLDQGRLELVPRRGLVEQLREVKDSAELAAVRRSAAILTEAIRSLAEGRSSAARSASWRGAWSSGCTSSARRTRRSRPSSPGSRGASPHAVPSDRRIEVGEMVVVDAGCKVNGYCSDCTRTFSTGKLPVELEEAYAVVLDAQLAGLAAVRPGADGTAVDGVARKVIEDAGLGERFGHGLGHGVGLEVHEAPWLNPELESTLAVGNVVTIEPGVYISGLGGIRIEDLAIVGADGAEVLTDLTKELTTVD